MSDTLRGIVDLVQRRETQISAHGYDELAEDGILAGEAIEGLTAAIVVEEYPECSKGPCTLVLQRDRAGNPIHVRGFPPEEAMNTRRQTKLVREGSYAAEVDVELIEGEDGWSPSLSLDDVHKLDAVREALRRGDIQAACRHARVFSLTPVSR